MIEEINGTPVHFVTEGSGRKKVLLLHGWGCDAGLMQPVASLLKNDFQVLIPEMPGHGQSGRPPEPWGVPEYADCLRELLARTDFLPCNVIAHSFGCRIAAWLEANNEKMFEKIVFTGAAGIRPVQTDEARKRSEHFKKMKEFSGRLKRIPLMSGVAENWESRLRQKYGSRDYNALDEEMRRTFVKVINQDLTELYERFHASTLLIWGENDTETPLWMAKEMEKRIPDAGLVILEGGTHLAYLEQLQRFTAIVSHFLKGEA